MASKQPVTPQRRKVLVRRWMAAFALAVLIPLTLGSTMIVLHGLPFFVFRSAGTGVTPDADTNLGENFGPGQPDAPKPHHPLDLGPCRTRVVHIYKPVRAQITIRTCIIGEQDARHARHAAKPR